MARLTREQQKEYEEELEYRRNQPVNIPDRPHQSAMDRIVNAAKGVGKHIQNFDQGPTGKAIRSYAERMNSREGLGGGDFSRRDNPPTEVYARRNAHSAAYPPPQSPVHQESSLHPGNRILVVEGRVLATAGRKNPDGPRRRPGRSIRQGGLGQEDDGLGFSSDRGL